MIESPRVAPLVNIANALTVLRLALVPVFLVLLFADGGHQAGWRLLAAATFAVASVTDRLDGQLARKHGLVTPFGMVADPIADKALTGAALVGLSVLGDLAWWVTAVIGLRELGVTVLRFWVLRHGVIPASRGGKLKTLVQGLALACYVLPLEAVAGAGRLVADVRWWTMSAALVLTVVTGLDYVIRALRLRTRGLAAAAPGASVGAFANGEHPDPDAGCA